MSSQGVEFLNLNSLLLFACRLSTTMSLKMSAASLDSSEM